MPSINTKKIRAAVIIAAPIFLFITILLSDMLWNSPKPEEKSVPTVSTDTAEETRAVWISYLEMQDILKNKSEAQFTASIGEYFDNCADIGINTIIFQVRSHGDAFYKSALFPTSVHFTGTRQLSAPFDPLKIAVREAHARKLKIEAWINPYRGPKIEDAKPLCDGGIFAKWLGTDKVFTAASGSDTYYYLNPTDSEVQQYVINGIREVAAGYDVDGIHFDDYFYPTQNPSVDAENYEKSGGGMSLADFRRKCVSDFIAEVYKTVKSIRNIPFGISPSGNIANNTDRYYADVKLWCSSKGYIDYIAPQLYWGYGEGTLPYDTALESWKSLVKSKDIRLIVGLAAYKVGENEYWRDGDILSRQVSDAQKCPQYSGFALFRYSYLFSDICNSEREKLFKNQRIS